MDDYSDKEIWAEYKNPIAFSSFKFRPNLFIRIVVHKDIIRFNRRIKENYSH